MKKKLLLMAGCGIFLLSCSESSARSSGNDFMGTVFIEGEYGVDRLKVYKYKFNGHNYQFHYVPHGQCSVGGPIHDPDCPCHDLKISTQRGEKTGH